MKAQIPVDFFQAMASAAPPAPMAAPAAVMDAQTPVAPADYAAAKRLPAFTAPIPD